MFKRVSFLSSQKNLFLKQNKNAESLVLSAFFDGLQNRLSKRDVKNHHQRKTDGGADGADVAVFAGL